MRSASGSASIPMDEDELAFVYEKNLKVLPTMAVVIGYPGFWAKELDTGIDWVKVVAGEHALTLHRPLAPAGTVISRTRVIEIVDKGVGKGAIIYSERTIDDKATGARIATIMQTTFCRGDGGFGGPPREQRAGASRSPSARPISSATCRPGRRRR